MSLEGYTRYKDVSQEVQCLYIVPILISRKDEARSEK